MFASGSLNLSVVIPVYNVRPDYFAQCIGSVAAAIGAYDPRYVEVVVVNDGSEPGLADQYRAALAATLRPGHRMVMLDRARNEGIAVARTAGIEASRGDWIVLVDADDLLSRQAFATLHRHLDGEAVLAYTAHQKLTHDLGSVIETRRKQRYFELLKTHAGKVDDPFLHYTFLIHMHVIRRAAFYAVGGFDPSITYGDEIDFHLRLTSTYRSAENYRYVDEILYFYRDNHEGICRNLNLYAELIRNIEGILLSHAQARGLEVSSCRRAEKGEGGAVRYRYLRDRNG